MPTTQQLLAAARRLESALERRHLSSGLLHGPDPGVRFNLRAWRFLKSILGFVPWCDDYVFTQTQGYWAFANWMLYDATGDQRFRRNALDCAEAVLRLETPEGAWIYPLPERKHLIATLESMMAAATLLAAYARELRMEFLEGACRAADFITRRIGFQAHDRGEAINYFDRPRGELPNNSVIAVWFFLRLGAAAGEDRFAAHVAPMVRFVESTQMASGEIPYIVEGPNEGARAHYLCFQYNAFQFLYMAWADRLAPGTWNRNALVKLAHFLRGGVDVNGACANNCAAVGAGGPETDYYTAALAAALHEAWRLGFWADDEPGLRCYDRVLARQKPDGSFGFSTGDYRVLSDTRSYPRQQAMTLFHLLYACNLGDGFPQASR